MNRLKDKYDIYILSTAPWDNPSAWSDKLEWVKRYLGEVCYKRLILSHHKNLNAGDYLIDDRKKRMVLLILKVSLYCSVLNGFQIGSLW